MCLRSRDSQTTKPSSRTWVICRSTGIPDISTISVNPDSAPTTGHAWTMARIIPAVIRRRLCTATLIPAILARPPADAPAVQGFAAQLGFRLPNMVISPFTRRHYVSHVPMDHTAVIKFVESRFIGADGPPYGPRCRTTEPAGLLRLHRNSLVDSAVGFQPPCSTSRGIDLHTGGDAVTPPVCQKG